MPPLQNPAQGSLWTKHTFKDTFKGSGDTAKFFQHDSVQGYMLPCGEMLCSWTDVYRYAPNIFCGGNDSRTHGSSCLLLQRMQTTSHSFHQCCGWLLEAQIGSKAIVTSSIWTSLKLVQAMVIKIKCMCEAALYLKADPWSIRVKSILRLQKKSFISSTSWFFYREMAATEPADGVFHGTIFPSVHYTGYFLTCCVSFPSTFNAL